MSTFGFLQQTPGSPPLEDEILPGYTAASREPHEHLNSGLDQGGKPWLTLRLLSDAPAGSKLPVYFSGSSVRGSASINLTRPQTIRSVTVEVRGKLCLATANGIPPLWHERKTLWASGESYDPTSIASAGSWEWSFSFPIPRHFDDSPNGGSKSIRLPGSFNLKPFIAFLEYHVFLFVKRGRWLPTETELHTHFAYVVRERAPPPSPLRELAYLEQLPPPPPSEDPAGWEPCGEIIASGVLFGDREVTVIYKPYLSKPCIYSRGGTIFYRVEVSTSDIQALQLMSSQSALSVTLSREIGCLHFGRAPQAAAGRKDLDIDVQTIAYGASWVDTRTIGESSNEVRVLEGEISVPSKIGLNLVMSVLELRYFVDFAVNATGFVPCNASLVAAKHPIRIVTHPALGVTPISRIPPGYEPTAVTLQVNAAPNSDRLNYSVGAEWM
ncbi:hypothetical protein FRC12_008150 [Ceratobasidium sp. 428]|nr:hypothetical protein FRC12_008150 [Ceratobasidium sp. 428]